MLLKNITINEANAIGNKLYPNTHKLWKNELLNIHNKI